MIKKTLGLQTLCETSLSLVGGKFLAVSEDRVLYPVVISQCLLEDGRVDCVNP